MTLKENYIDEINSLKKKLKDLNIKIQNYEEKIELYEKKFNQQNTKEYFVKGMNLYGIFYGFFTIVSCLLIIIQLNTDGEPEYKLLFLSISFLIISIVILSLKGLKSSLSSPENTYENKFGIVFPGCFILLINTTVLFNINGIVSLSEKKIGVDMFNPSGFFKQASEYGLSVIGTFILFTGIIICFVNKILKEDHKKGPLTPVDQKGISQEKFNEILKKIKTIGDFLYKYGTYSILFMIGTFGIIMGKFIFVSGYYPIEKNLFHFIINDDPSFGIFMGTFFIGSFIGIFIIFLRIFIGILLFIYVEKKEYAWATYTFIVNTLKGNEYDMGILLGKLMGFLIAFYVAHSAMDNGFIENFPDNNLIREYIDYPIRRFCYSIVPPAKPIHDITQVYGSYEKIPYYVPKGPLSP